MQRRPSRKRHRAPVRRHARDRPGPDERPLDTERFNNQNPPIDVPILLGLGRSGSRVLERQTQFQRPMRSPVRFRVRRRTHICRQKPGQPEIQACPKT